MPSYLHDDTPHRRAKHQPECKICGKPSAVLFKDVWNDFATWVYLSCDECLSCVCRACSDEDEDGHATCTSCIETALHIEGNTRTARPAPVPLRRRREPGSATAPVPGVPRVPRGA